MPTYLKRPTSVDKTIASPQEVAATVRGVIADVRENGDAAVRLYSEKFDNWSPESFRLSQDQIEQIVVDPAGAGDRRHRVRADPDP